MQGFTSQPRTPKQGCYAQRILYLPEARTSVCIVKYPDQHHVQDFGQASNVFTDRIVSRFLQSLGKLGQYGDKSVLGHRGSELDLIEERGQRLHEMLAKSEGERWG